MVRMVGDGLALKHCGCVVVVVVVVDRAVCMIIRRGSSLRREKGRK